MISASSKNPKTKVMLNMYVNTIIMIKPILQLDTWEY